MVNHVLFHLVSLAIIVVLVIVKVIISVQRPHSSQSSHHLKLLTLPILSFLLIKKFDSTSLAIVFRHPADGWMIPTECPLLGKTEPYQLMFFPL